MVNVDPTDAVQRVFFSQSVEGAIAMPTVFDTAAYIIQQRGPMTAMMTFCFPPQ
jgi:hypothetical protein